MPSVAGVVTSSKHKASSHGCFLIATRFKDGLDGVGSPHGKRKMAREATAGSSDISVCGVRQRQHHEGDGGDGAPANLQWQNKVSSKARTLTKQSGPPDSGCVSVLNGDEWKSGNSCT